MTPPEFLELFVSVSLQATVVVATTYRIAGQFSSERARCRMWTTCYVGLLVLLISAAAVPHLRILPPFRPQSRPLAVEMVTLQMQAGRLLLFCWAVGAVASLVLFAARSVQAARFLKTCRQIDLQRLPSVAPGMSDSGDSLTFVANRRVRLVSTVLPVPPFCWQLHQPYIVIPETLLQTLNRDDLVFVLRHELAHLRTGHPLQVFLQRSVEMLFWFHPMVWWASREWSLSREFQCDDEAVDSQTDIIRYLKTLLAIAEQTVTAATSTVTTPALSLIRNRCEMAERARRLVKIAQQTPDESTGAQTSSRKVVFGTTKIAVAGVLSPAVLWLPINAAASPGSHWSPWPSWTAAVLKDVGINARDFEVYDHRYALNELLQEESEPESSSEPAAK